MGPHVEKIPVPCDNPSLMPCADRLDAVAVNPNSSAVPKGELSLAAFPREDVELQFLGIWKRVRWQAEDFHLEFPTLFYPEHESEHHSG